MRVGVLGPLTVETTNGALSPRDRVVLSVLVLHGDEVVSAERLADALWGDEPPASAGKVIQGCIVRLRKALGPASIETHPGGYRLALSADDVDLHRFERLLGRARELLALRAPDRALRTAEEALTLWRGRPFDDVDGWDAARIEGARLEELRHEAEELRVDAALRSGRHHEILATARGLVDAAPTRERRWELLALAQYRSGSQADALRTLHEARRRLADELGLDPGSGIVELEGAILRQDAELAGPTIPSVVDESCPWPGLLPYSVEDADGFAGREREVDAALARLAANGVLVVVGPSGSGKSSLVRAGVGGKLQRDGRRVMMIVTPGPRPMDTLTRRGSTAGAVLVVDQCEEAVTACDDPFEREAFFAALVAHAEGSPLVVALRADRLGDLSEHPAFARLVERGLFLLPPMDEPALRAAIERPARAAGLLLEPGLVDLVVRDVLDEPGALPLMSHALQQTWTRREGRTLTVAGYAETGGIRSAVAQSAEAIYAGIDPEEQPKLRNLLLRLVTPVEDGAPARARLPHRAIAEDPGYRRLVDRLVEARLLTTDGEVVELAHEALARAWPRFRDWLEEDIEGLRVLRHLNGAAAGWDALGRPDSELYRGERLAGVVAWRERAAPELTSIEAAFVAASIERQREDLQAAEVQVERERRTVHRLRRLVSGVAVLAVLALAATAVALHQRDTADDQARVAEARRLSAEALEARPYDRALLLALEAVRRSDDPETQGALLTTIGRSPLITSVLRSTGDRIFELDVARTDDRVAIVDVLGALTVFDTDSRAAIGATDDDGAIRRAPAFSPDGGSLAVSRMEERCFFEPCSDFAVDVYPTGDLGEAPTAYTGIAGPPVAVTWSADGELLAAAPAFVDASRVHNISVWRVGSPDTPFQRLTLHERGANQPRIPDDGFPPAWLRISPDGRTLYASGAGPVVAFDIASGEEVARYEGVGGLAISADGATLAVATDGGGVRLLDAATGATLVDLAGHDDAVTAADFDDDGSRIATGSIDETVAVWETTTGERLRLLEGHAGSVSDVAFGRADRLYSAGADRSLYAWDVDGAASLARTLAGPSLDVRTESLVHVSPSGDYVAVRFNRLHLIDVERGLVRELDPDGGVTGIAFSPDSSRLATIDYDGNLATWRTSDGERVATNPPAGEGTHSPIAFTPDGSGLVVVGIDGAMVELVTDTLEPTGAAIALDLEGEPADIQVAADGRFAVTTPATGASGGTDITVGDLDTGRIGRRVHLASRDVISSFSTDGDRLAFGGADGRVGVVDVTTGEVDGPRDPVHAGAVSWVGFSPDGATLASLGFDGFLILAAPDDAHPQARFLPGPINRNGSVAYAPDGHTVVLAYRDGTVLEFDTDPAAWVAHACAVAGRDLTEDEWQDAFGDEPHRATC